MKKEDFISIHDLTLDQAEQLLDRGAHLKTRSGNERFTPACTSDSILIIMEKPSLRTRLSFEAGMAELGGYAMFIDHTHSRLDAEKRESLCAVAMNISRQVKLIVARTFDHDTVVQLFT